MYIYLFIFLYHQLTQHQMTFVLCCCQVLYEKELSLNLSIKYIQTIGGDNIINHVKVICMMNKKSQTIQGFLSPTKLLSTGSRNVGKNIKGPKSPIGSSSIKKQGYDSKFNSQNQSMLNTSREIQKNQLFQTGSIEHSKDTNLSRLTGEKNLIFSSLPDDRKYNSDGNFAFVLDRETRSNFNEVYKKVSKSIEEQERQQNHSQKRVHSQINKQKWGTQQLQSPPFSQSRLNNDTSANFRQNSSSKPSLSQGIYTNIKTNNSQTMTIQCYELIRKLSKIKQNLQLQILQLQTLLDNTSKYMQNMDQEFDKIKDSILSYTAKCLDGAFTEYKQNMVEWQKYEDFQRKSLTMLTEINEFIYNEEQKLSTNNNLTGKEISTIALELERQITYYRKFADEIKKIRQQCVGMRPTLTEDRIKAFEKGLTILCSF